MPNKAFVLFLVFIYVYALFYTTVFTSLDQGEEAEVSDVIIVAEGSIERSYTAIDLLFEDYSTEYKIIESPMTSVISTLVPSCTVKSSVPERSGEALAFTTP